MDGQEHGKGSRGESRLEQGLLKGNPRHAEMLSGQNPIMRLQVPPFEDIRRHQNSASHSRLAGAGENLFQMNASKLLAMARRYASGIPPI
jgi:hypothetical protein